MYNEISCDINNEIDNSNEDSDAPPLDAPDIPTNALIYALINIFNEISDNFITQKDNFIIFTAQGEPCDQEAHACERRVTTANRRHYSRTR